MLAVELRFASGAIVAAVVLIVVLETVVEEHWLRKVLLELESDDALGVDLAHVVVTVHSALLRVGCRDHQPRTEDRKEHAQQDKRQDHHERWHHDLPRVQLLLLEALQERHFASALLLFLLFLFLSIIVIIVVHGRLLGLGGRDVVLIRVGGRRGRLGLGLRVRIILLKLSVVVRFRFRVRVVLFHLPVRARVCVSSHFSSPCCCSFLVALGRLCLLCPLCFACFASLLLLAVAA
mmetsp:Transcript_6300/g.10277  ORF Transcript_6300/g.10277 Transcript_6300/m.10277 type:complete len:235 (-) Transcript_6300:15-719(-)